MDTLFESYWFYGDLWYIISKADNGYKYVLKNFLNIYSYGWDTMSLYFEIEFSKKVSHIELLKDNPFISCLSVERNGQTLIDVDYIKEQINNGWYVLAKINKSFIRDCPNAGSISHEVLIHDYKDERFLFCDNSSSGKYLTSLSCGFSDFMKGYEYIDSPEITDDVFWKKKIELFKLRQPNDYSLYGRDIVTSLKQYLNLEEKPVFQSPELLDVYDNMELFIGNRTYDYLCVFLQNHSVNRINHHLGAISVILDHKRVLLFAVEILASKGLVSEQYINIFRALYNDVYTLRMLIIKFYMDESNDSLLERIVRRIKIIKRQEQDCIIRLITDLLSHESISI